MSTADGSENGTRSGAQTLVMLAAPLNATILHALADDAKRQVDLRHLTGAPAQTTLRAQLNKMVDIGALEKHRRNPFPGVLEYEMTAAGRGLLFVAEALDRWLGEAPAEPLSLGSDRARATIKAFAEAWSSTMVRTLAAGALSLTELDRLIDAVSYPALERRLAALRLAGLVEARRGNGRGTPYALTNWLRRGVGPLVAAARWERRNRPAYTAPMDRADVEAVLTLAIPRDGFSATHRGVCRLVVELNAGSTDPATISVPIGKRRSRSSAKRQSSASAWVAGSVGTWFGALIDADYEPLELGGDQRLARGVLRDLHRGLFGPPKRRRTGAQ